MDSGKFDLAVKEVKQTMVAFGVPDVEGKLAWSIVRDLVWSKVIE